MGVESIYLSYKNVERDTSTLEIERSHIFMFNNSSLKYRRLFCQ